MDALGRFHDGSKSKPPLPYLEMLKERAKIDRVKLREVVNDKVYFGPRLMNEINDGQNDKLNVESFKYVPQGEGHRPKKESLIDNIQERGVGYLLKNVRKEDTRVGFRPRVYDSEISYPRRYMRGSRGLTNFLKLEKRLAKDRVPNKQAPKKRLQSRKNKRGRDDQNGQNGQDNQDGGDLYDGDGYDGNDGYDGELNNAQAEKPSGKRKGKRKGHHKRNVENRKKRAMEAVNSAPVQPILQGEPVQQNVQASEGLSKKKRKKARNKENKRATKRQRLAENQIAAPVAKAPARMAPLSILYNSRAKRHKRNRLNKQKRRAQENEQRLELYRNAPFFRQIKK